jgi:hypothetical protein
VSNTNLTPKDIERFRSKVDRRGPDECWPWTAGRDVSGHGVFWLKPKYRPAHVVAWEIENGPMPEGLIGLHTCDNPPCVNPNHITPGTHRQNKMDSVLRGRGTKAKRAHLPPYGYWGRKLT